MSGYIKKPSGLCKWCGEVQAAVYHDCNYVALRDELYCPHNVGHSMGVHGCCQCSCCKKKEWKDAWKKYRRVGVKRSVL